MTLFAYPRVARALAALLSTAILPLAHAGTIDSALKSYDAGQYEDAARVLRGDAQPSARVSGMLCELHVRGLVVDQKDETRQACGAAVAGHDPLGLMVYAGAYGAANPPAGIVRDEQRFVSYLAEAIELGFPPAYERFCDYFFAKKMFSEATPFCKFAAASKLPGAMYNMSLMLFDGKGAVQNFDRARQFALASARMNYAPAYKLLGDLSSEGKLGNAKDLVQAYAWYALASSAAPDWSDPVALRNGLDLNGEQVARAQALAGKWTPEPVPNIRQFYAAKLAVK
jgi:TPR repeat protein